MSAFNFKQNTDVLKCEDVVFARIGSTYPSWPAIVDNIECGKYTVKLLNNPSKQKGIIICDRSSLIEWDATKQNGEAINYGDIISLHLHENNLKNIEQIDNDIWNKWNRATLVANKEVERLMELQRISEQRKKEEKEMRKRNYDETKKKEMYSNKIYDGRTLGNDMQINGHILKAGDKILFYEQNLCSKGNEGTETIITKIGDLYEIQKYANIAPIDVECGRLEFDTEIMKIGSSDTNFYALSECKLIPSQVESDLDKEQQRIRNSMDPHLWKKFGLQLL